MARTSRRSKGSSLRVNLAEVEGRVKIPEGEHPIIVTEVTQEEGNAGAYLKWKFKVTGGDAEGGILYYNTSLTPQALWNLKSLLEALNFEIPDDEFDLPLDEFVDLECMGSVEHETYDGKKQSRLVDFWPAEKKKSKKKDDDDEDEKPARGKRKAKDEDEDEKPAKGKRRAKDDDEDEKPSRSKGGSKKSKKKTPQEEVDGMDEDELEEFVKEHDLDVDLDDFKTLRKKRTAVVDAGIEADVIEE